VKYLLPLILILMVGCNTTKSMNFKLEAANSGGGIATVIAVEEDYAKIEDIKLASDAVRKALQGDLTSEGLQKVVQKHFGYYSDLGNQILAFIPKSTVSTAIPPDVKKVILEFLDGVDHRCARWQTTE